MIKFNCPYCEQSLEAEDDMVGVEIECPACGKSMRVKQAIEPAAPVVSHSIPRNPNKRFWAFMCGFGLCYCAAMVFQFTRGIGLAITLLLGICSALCLAACVRTLCPDLPSGRTTKVFVLTLLGSLLPVIASTGYLGFLTLILYIAFAFVPFVAIPGLISAGRRSWVRECLQVTILPTLVFSVIVIVGITTLGIHGEFSVVAALFSIIAFQGYGVWRFCSLVGPDGLADMPSGQGLLPTWRSMSIVGASVLLVSGAVLGIERRNERIASREYEATQRLERTERQAQSETMYRFLDGYCTAWCRLSRNPPPAGEWTSLDAVSVFCARNNMSADTPNFGITDYEILNWEPFVSPTQAEWGYSQSFAFSLRVTVMNRAGAPIGPRRVNGEIHCGRYGSVNKMSIDI